jgi:hypothetical protein
MIHKGIKNRRDLTKNGNIFDIYLLKRKKHTKSLDIPQHLYTFAI